MFSMFVNTAVKTTALQHSMVTAFLKGESTIQVSNIVDAIYRHTDSQPNIDSEYVYGKDLSFSPTILPKNIHHACPSLSLLATL
jgi:hypothetical protein